MHVACVCASRNISVGGGWSPQHHVLVYVWIELYIFFFLTFTSLYNYALPLEYKPHEDRDRVYVVAFVTLATLVPALRLMEMNRCTLKGLLGGIK